MPGINGAASNAIIVSIVGRVTIVTGSCDARDEVGIEEGGIVELLACRRAALGELHLVPVHRDEPAVGWKLRRSLGQRLLKRRYVSDPWGHQALHPAVERRNRHVMVRVHEAREYERTPDIDETRRLAGSERYLVGFSNGD